MAGTKRMKGTGEEGALLQQRVRERLDSGECDCTSQRQLEVAIDAATGEATRIFKGRQGLTGQLLLEMATHLKCTARGLVDGTRWVELLPEEAEPESASEVEKLRLKLEALEREVAALEADNAQLQASDEQCASKLAAAQGQVDDLSRTRDVWKQRTKQLEAERVALRRQNAGLRGQLLSVSSVRSQLAQQVDHLVREVHAWGDSHRAVVQQRDELQRTLTTTSNFALRQFNRANALSREITQLRAKLVSSHVQLVKEQATSKRRASGEPGKVALAAGLGFVLGRVSRD